MKPDTRRSVAPHREARHRQGADFARLTAADENNGANRTTVAAGYCSPAVILCLTLNSYRIISGIVRSVEGRRREAFGWWDRMRRPRAWFAPTHSGGHGAPVG